MTRNVQRSRRITRQQVKEDGGKKLLVQNKRTKARRKTSEVQEIEGV